MTNQKDRGQTSVFSLYGFPMVSKTNVQESKPLWGFHSRMWLCTSQESTPFGHMALGTSRWMATPPRRLPRLQRSRARSGNHHAPILHDNGDMQANDASLAVVYVPILHDGIHRGGVHRGGVLRMLRLRTLRWQLRLLVSWSFWFLRLLCFSLWKSLLA